MARQKRIPAINVTYWDDVASVIEEENEAWLTLFACRDYYETAQRYNACSVVKAQLISNGEVITPHHASYPPGGADYPSPLHRPLRSIWNEGLF